MGNQTAAFLLNYDTDLSRVYTENQAGPDNKYHEPNGEPRPAPENVPTYDAIMEKILDGGLRKISPEERGTYPSGDRIMEMGEFTVIYAAAADEDGPAGLYIMETKWDTFEPVGFYPAPSFIRG